MKKIFYDKNGWVCKRHPYDIAITKNTKFIKVDEELYSKTLQCEIGKAWRVIDGKLSMEVYDEKEYQKNIYTEEICLLKQKLADMDYKTSKYADGEYTAEEWQSIVAERKSIREKITELEKLI